MSNQMIYLRDELQNKLKKEENMSRLINNLLFHYYNDLENLNISDLEKEEQEVIQRAEMIKEKKRLAVKNEELKFIEEQQNKLDQLSNECKNKRMIAKEWIRSKGLVEQYWDEKEKDPMLTPEDFYDLKTLIKEKEG